MPSLTSCIFEHTNFTGAADCNSIGFSSGSWAWATWTFSNRRASLARVRTDSELIVPLTRTLDTPANRSLLDAQLPREANRITGIRAGMVPYSVVPYSGSHPTRHPSWRVLVDISFRVEIKLPWYCPDTKATIHYYVHLFLNASRNLQANVDGWSWRRTESAGVCGGAVASKLNSAVPSGIGPLQGGLNAQLAPFSSFVFSSIYFLPGDGRNSGVENVADVRNDAAVILVR